MCTFLGMGPQFLVRTEVANPQWFLADVSPTTRTTGHILLLQAAQERARGYSQDANGKDPGIHGLYHSRTVILQ